MIMTDMPTSAAGAATQSRHPQRITPDLGPDGSRNRHGRARKHEQPAHAQPIDELRERLVDKECRPFQGNARQDDRNDHQGSPWQWFCPPPREYDVAFVAVLRTHHTASLAAREVTAEARG